MNGTDQFVGNSDKSSEGDIFAALDERQRAFLPVVVVLGAMAVVGSFGNGLACWVYLKPLRGSVNARLLAYLSMVDLVICLVCIPMEMYDLIAPYVPLELCKFIHVFISMPVLLSGELLTLVAVDRYIGLCHPIKKIRFTQVLHRILLAAVVLAIALAIPRLQTAQLLTRRDGSIKCGSNLQQSGPVPLIYFSTLAFCHFASALIVAVLYTLIRRHLKHHARTMKQGDVRSTSFTSFSRVTRICFIVTLVYYVSFLPYAVETIVFAALKMSSLEWTGVSLTLTVMGSRMMFLGNVVNPFIYSMVSKNFRRHCVSLFSRCGTRVDT